MTEQKFFIRSNESADKKFCAELPLYEEESFDSVLEGEFSDSRVKEGDVIEGVITSIGKSFILVNVGLKSEGEIPVQQFPNAASLEVGSKVSVYVEKTETRDGNIALSHSKALRHHTWQKLYNSWLEGKEEDVEGVISHTIKTGCIVDIEGLNAFLPNNHLDTKSVSDPSGLLGVKLKFRILKMEQKTNKIFVSRKKALGAVYEAGKTEYISNLKVGTIIEGKVKSVANYGVFVQIHESEKAGVVDGLLYINEISWARVAHPSSVYSIGQDVKVIVIGVDKEKERISLGVKQLTENPWKGISKKYIAGNIYDGVVSALEDYGVFVRLEDGVEGLVHNGEMSWTKEKPLLLPNQKIKVMLMSVDEDNHKIALSVRRCKENPWKKFLDHNNLGSVIKCKVVDIMDSGICVSPLDEEFSYVNGYIRSHNISWDHRSKKTVKDFAVGDEVKAKLIHVNLEKGRIMFSTKHVEYDPFEEFLGYVKKGDKLTAKILRVEDDGIYIEVKDKLEFFVQQSDVSSLYVGQECVFAVKNKDKYSIELDVVQEENKDNQEEQGVGDE